MTDPKQGWVKCPAGELERMEQRIWYARAKQLAITVAAALACSGAVAFAAWEVSTVIVPSFSAPARTGGNPPSCERVIPCSEEFPQEAPKQP